MSNANAAAEQFGPLLLPLFFLSFYSVSQLLSVAPPETLHITACTCFSRGGRDALMSLTSITFAGLHVSAPQSASQNHLRHNGRIVRFTIRCLNFEWLPESLPAATPPRKKITYKTFELLQE